MAFSIGGLQINNPMANANQPAAPGGGGNVWATTPAQQAAFASSGNAAAAALASLHPVASTQTAPGGGAGVRGTGSATTMNQPEYLQGIQQEYGNAIQAAQNQIAGQNAYLPTAQNDINQTARASMDQANKTATDTLGQLGQQASNTQSQQRLSLAELADQIHGQNQGLMNQLGASGAGFSSAVQTGQQALQHAQNSQAANINSQANAGLANINQEKQTTNDTLQTALEGVNSWKQTQLDSILNNYQQTMAQLNGALGQAQGEEKARLALYGQQISAQAANALGNLQNVTTQAIAHAQQGLQQAATAKPAEVQFAAPTQPNNITYDTTSPFAANTNPQGNATSSGAVPNMAALASQYQDPNQTALR